MSEFKIPSSLAEAIKNAPTELKTLVGRVDPNERLKESTIHTFMIPRGNFVIANPGNPKHTVEFVPKTDKGEIAMGFAVIYAKAVLQQVLFPICVFSITDIRNGVTKLWEAGQVVSPGDSIVVKFYGWDIIDPSKTTLNYTIDVRDITL